MLFSVRQIPTFSTERLILRPITPEDAPALQKIANNRAISYTTAAIPYPYTLEHANQWIASLKNLLFYQQVLNFAIVSKPTRELIGVMGLTFFTDCDQADLGYWIGPSYWNQGYITEAARRLFIYMFEELDLNAATANHLVRNPASGRVMQKLGMSFQYRQIEGIRKWGVYEHLDHYILYAKDYFKQKPSYQAFLLKV